ncbi:MAG: molybdate ABC transporter substrate-binding protein, partial [Tissierellia bacterium]|nr:molybdate ABC transporter substrate-binding protein [Tissierellia bacterium]
EDLKDMDGRIAIAETETVPVGQYTKQTLENLNMWDDIQDKVVTAKDVKATLAYVDQGEVDAGFVYKSDAEQAKSSDISVEVDNSLHDRILYPQAIVSASENKENAKKFLEFLKTDEAKAVFEKFGFKVVED